MAAQQDTLPADIALEQLRSRVHGRLFGSRLEPVTIGRYEVREYIGAGGMGVVYSAWDPELDRAVAIKLLRSDALEDTARARLRREAKALAKLSHPNVVHVYEVGSDDAQVFVAMEYVEGETLTQWLEDDTHDVDAILAMFVAVGRGLAAAHEAGLVHRDFKPDNVLIDSTGRPRVVDFGLVLGTQDRSTLPEPAGVGAEPDAPLSLTATGTLVGTPAYMAPEQHRGDTADVRTDIFAYCVALYEALYGMRPFGGDTYPVLAASVLRGELRTPPPDKLHRVPRRIRDAVTRGLARDPNDRFASVNDLLEALTRAARRRVHPIWWGAGACTLACAFAAGSFLRAPAASEEVPVSGEVCEAASVKLEGAWDDGVKARVREAFRATDQAFADESFAQVEANLEAWAARWKDAWTGACESALGRDADDAELGMKQMRCLDVQLAEVRQLTEVFADADPKVVEQAAEASAAIADASTCEASWEGAPRPATDESKAIELQLARAAGKFAAGRESEASALADEAQRAAHALGRSDLEARGKLLMVRARAAEDPIRMLHEVVALADEADDRRTQGEAWIEMVAVAAEQREDAPELPVAAWADMAQRVLDGKGDPRMELALHYNLARYYREHDALDSARERIDRAQRVDVALASIAGARLETVHGQVELQAGRKQAAAEHFRKATVRLRDAVGSDHPETMFAAYMLASVTDDAKEAAELSRDIYAKSVSGKRIDADDVRQAVGALQLMRRTQAESAVSEAELEVVLEKAGSKEAKRLAKATRMLVARADDDEATLVLGNGIAITVDGDEAKIAIDTSKIEFPGCKRGQKCTIDSWPFKTPRPPKPPKLGKLEPPEAPEPPAPPR